MSKIAWCKSGRIFVTKSRRPLSFATISSTSFSINKSRLPLSSVDDSVALSRSFWKVSLIRGERTSGLTVEFSPRDTKSMAEFKLRLWWTWNWMKLKKKKETSFFPLLHFLIQHTIHLFAWQACQRNYVVSWHKTSGFQNNFSCKHINYYLYCRIFPTFDTFLGFVGKPGVTIGIWKVLAYEWKVWKDSEFIDPTIAYTPRKNWLHTLGFVDENRVGNDDKLVYFVPEKGFKQKKRKGC